MPRLLAAPLAVLLLAAAPPPAKGRAEHARGLLQDCDALMLWASSLKPLTGQEKDDAALAKLLVEAARKKCAEDKVVAFTLAETATRLAPADVEALLAFADAARAANHQGEAAEALDKAIAVSPRDDSLRIRRARMALDEHDAHQALAVLEPIIATNPQAKALAADAERLKEESRAPAKTEQSASEKAMLAAVRLHRASEQKEKPASEDDAPTSDPEQVDPGPSNEAIFSQDPFEVQQRRTFKIPTAKGKAYTLKLVGGCSDAKAGTLVMKAGPGADLRVAIAGAEKKLEWSPESPGQATGSFDFTAVSPETKVDVFNQGGATPAHCVMLTMTVTPR